MKTAIPLSMALVLALSPACDESDPTGPVDDGEYVRSADDAPTAPPAKLHKVAPQPKPRPALPDARATFETVTQLLAEHYVDGPLSEDELWTGAIEGVLGRLEQPAGYDVNTLLSPADLRALEIGTSGRLVGVGVMIERVADVVVVRGLIDDAPAQRAGLERGDRILGVDGHRLRDLDMRQVADKIRGKTGTTVELFVQRDTEEWTVAVERGAVVVSSVEARLLKGNVGLMRISSFSQGVPADVDQRLERLQAEGMEGLVLDLRDCPGGLLDASLEVADRFLAAGSRIVTVSGRGDEEKHFDAESTDPWESLPIVILIGPHTASSAEIIAGALAAHGRARLVGQPTFGKHTVEAVLDLPKGWALKLSTSRFAPPPGEHWTAPGVRPDIMLPPAPDQRSQPRFADATPETDPQLAAAVELLSTN